MRNILLGTTALVAAGVLGAADAQAKFDVTIRGNYTAGYGFVNEDDDNGEAGNAKQNQALNQDVEVHFRFEQTMDNGIAVGGRVELEGATHGGAASTRNASAGSDQIDERWAYFRGGFGEIRFGDEDDARYLKSLTSPDPTGFIFGVNSPTFTFNNNTTGAGFAATTNTTAPSLVGDSTKIIYFTPSFGGFQLAVSYTPDGTQDRAQAGTGGTNEPQISDAWALGADYSGEFSGMTVAIGGGYSIGSRERGNVYDNSKPTAWNVGLNVGFGGFTVGGSIAFTDADMPAGNDDTTVYDIGATYTMDAITVGLGWSHGEYEAADGDDEQDHVQLGAGYALGEGVTLAAFVGWFDYDDKGAADNDNTGWQTGVGVGLGF